jgi:hypothetical protein
MVRFASPSKWPQSRLRAASYIALLLLLNYYFAEKLFFVDFTNNMQTNAGSFMAISRFIMHHWAHLGWFPWWFNGEPFENSYTPMLHFVDAAFAGITGTSVARAYNCVTGCFYVLGPVFLFLFAWRVSGFLDTSFLAALMYSLFSPCVMFSVFRNDVGLWNPWRLRVLVQYGEGPHTTVLSTFPLALLFVYFAFSTRKYLWCAGASLIMAWVALVNTFGAVDLGLGCCCLVLALPKRNILNASALVLGMAVTAYLLAARYFTPTFLVTMAADSQKVGGDFNNDKLLATCAIILPGFVLLCIVVRWIDEYFIRFSLLFTYLVFGIVALFALAGKAALPQPHRYSLELELGVSLVAAFGFRAVVVRISPWAKFFAILLIAFAAYHQTIQYRRYARAIIQKIDITQTIEYKTAKWLDANLGDLRVFVSAQPGYWFNVFSDTPQMHSGHDPFNPNFAVEEAAVYAIYSDREEGWRDAQTSILWLKAFGCHAIYVPGPMSRVATKPFVHPRKFQGVLRVLWHEEDDTIYAIPQRSASLAHVVRENDIVHSQPVNGLDTDELAHYVAALDDQSLPVDVMTWSDPNHGHISTTLHPGQVLSIQSTYDKGWIASANGKPAGVTRDAIGLSVVHPSCDGPCSIDFVFNDGVERHLFRALSWIMFTGLLGGGILLYRRGTLR